MVAKGDANVQRCTEIARRALRGPLQLVLSVTDIILLTPCLYDC